MKTGEGLFQHAKTSPQILRPPIQAEQCGLKLKFVWKQKGIYIENTLVVLLMDDLKIEGSYITGTIYMYTMLPDSQTDRTDPLNFAAYCTVFKDGFLSLHPLMFLPIFSKAAFAVYKEVQLEHNLSPNWFKSCFIHVCWLRLVLRLLKQYLTGKRQLVTAYFFFKSRVLHTCTSAAFIPKHFNVPVSA